jgi:KaiC/GvpD/RAD55 family RecA-like ATPase
MTEVEQYVLSKEWDYRSSGNQIILDVCPFCHKDGFKFFINEDNGLYDCKRPDCVANAGGNLWKLKTHMGDKVEEVSEKVASQKTKGVVKMEGIPNYELAHEWLLENSTLMNYLEDHRGWNFDLVSRMKIGYMNRWIAEEQKEVGCWTYPYIIKGKCEFVKFRTLPGLNKNFASLAGRPVPLYNQDAVKKGMEYLVLVEGEADCLSVLSIGEENVVGVPGAGMKQVTWADMLNYPGKKYLLFDNDEDGQAGAKKFAERFGVDQFHNIVLPEFDLTEPIEDKHGTRTKGKDVTEWIAEGNGLEEFKELLSSAEMFSLDGVSSITRSLSNLRHDIVERGDNLPKYDTPWTDLNKAFGGAEDGQLVIIQAAQKTGKTSLALNWADYLAKEKKVPVHFECLEMPDSALVRKWASYVTDTDDTPGKMSYTEVLEMLDKARDEARTRDCEVLFGYTTVTSLEAEFERLKSIIRRFGIKVLFFDNLQFLVDKLYQGEKQGGRPAFMSKITKMFKSLAMEMKILVVLIAQTKSLQDDQVATAKSLEGSSAPGNDCDTMMIANRTKTMPVTSKNELMKMAGYGDNMLATQTLNPELFIEVGLTRLAGGGLVVLMIDGSRSKVTTRTPDQVRIAADAANLDKDGKIGGTNWKVAPSPKAPPKERPPVSERPVFTQTGETATHDDDKENHRAETEAAGTTAAGTTDVSEMPTQVDGA